ncbi:oligopeptide transporter OPT1 Ecym_7185 [Eremothecium cymbalariae DBVPG|uniref:OPT family small oligopeptide transporter n=1 Tax=Eremothecium cymbalariae (strain CBS 270.75 / DBVPG 7215 / KCTC 17166 / NRRL Y-17582) TaxID=931890 RepID=G8JW18_ERECY|nr:hypothetical protein Ecym_7185 [Eremothecium cymbalariae DBVPG\
MEAIKSILSRDAPITEKVPAKVQHNEKDGHISSVHLVKDEIQPSESLPHYPLIDKLSGQVDVDEYASLTVEGDSPYPEVRAAVPSYDDSSLLQNTVRMWAIGLFMTTVGSALNMLFSMHTPPIALTAFVTSLMGWPMGKAWEYFVPNWRLFGPLGGPYLNPTPFNLKEHALITIMGNVAFGGGNAYATDILLSMHIKDFYNRNYGWAFDLLAVWSTQCIGFSLAGMCHQILVKPAVMIWPSALVTCTFLTNIHINENHVANGWKISRLKFFLIVFIIGFVWYWIPGYLFQALGTFVWPLWIAPKNVIVNQLFGPQTGMGLLPLTFDWNQISGFTGSPLVPPVSAIITIAISVVSIFWILLPIIHYSNIWYGKYLPMSRSKSYDRYQNTYNVSAIVDETLSLDKQEYQNYSPLYLPTSFAISYGMSFASITATVMHTILFHGKDIVARMRSLKTEEEDVHARLMKSYKTVPWWWYACVFLVFLAMSIAVIAGWDTQMPIWALIFALGIATVFLLPVGIIYALTNISVGLNVITEFLIGYVLPGRPIAMMFFKTFGYITNNQAITFAQDMKIGHYLKLAPRLMFTAQFLATIWGGTVQVAVMRWAEGNIPDLCTKDGSFNCPHATVFFNASIIWGVIGPQRMFSSGQLYSKLNYFFIAGAILPVINWLILNKWPKRFEKYGRIPKICAKYLSWPVFFSGTGMIPPATAYNYGAYCILGIFFGYFVKRYWFHWWTKYNYSLSAALDIGLAWSALIVFFSTSIHTVNPPSWWGNNVVSNTLDSKGTAMQITLTSSEDFFGPSSW